MGQDPIPYFALKKGCTEFSWTVPSALLDTYSRSEQKRKRKARQRANQKGMPDAERGKSVGIRVSGADITEGTGETAPFVRPDRKNARFDTGGSFIELI